MDAGHWLRGAHCGGDDLSSVIVVVCLKETDRDDSRCYRFYILCSYNKVE
jgi:hypothetical protein